MTVATTTMQAMTPQQLTKKILANEELFILDVRNTSEFDNWKIDGGKTETLNIPYFDLLDGVDEALDKIPNGKDILVVCAKEGSSIFVAEQLVEAGRTNIHYLKGGMKAWSEYLEPVKVGDLKDGGELYQFVRIGKGCLSYLVLSDGEAATIDTLRMIEVFEQFANNKGVKIKHTIDTHLHADHISGGRLLAEKLELPTGSLRRTQRKSLSHTNLLKKEEKLLSEIKDPYPTDLFPRSYDRKYILYRR